MAAFVGKTIAWGIAGGILGGLQADIRGQWKIHTRLNSSGIILDQERRRHANYAALTTGLITGVTQGIVSGLWHVIVHRAILQGRKPIRSMLYFGRKAAPPLAIALCVGLELVSASSLLQDAEQADADIQAAVSHAAASSFMFGKLAIAPGGELRLASAPRPDLYELINANVMMLSLAKHSDNLIPMVGLDALVGFGCYAFLPPHLRACRTAMFWSFFEASFSKDAAIDVMQSPDWLALKAQNTEAEFARIRNADGSFKAESMNVDVMQDLQDARMVRLGALVASGDTETIARQKHLWRFAQDALADPPLVYDGRLAPAGPIGLEGPDFEHMTSSDLAAFRDHVERRGGPGKVHLPHKPQMDAVWGRHPARLMAMKLGLMRSRYILRAEARRVLQAAGVPYDDDEFDHDDARSRGPITDGLDMVRLALQQTGGGGVDILEVEEVLGHCMLLCKALPEFAATGLCNRRCSLKGGMIQGGMIQGGMVLVRTDDGVGFDSERLVILLYELADKIIANPSEVIKSAASDETDTEATSLVAHSLSELFATQPAEELTPSLESERARAIDVSNTTNVILRGASPVITLAMRLVVGAGMSAEPGSDPSTWVIDLSKTASSVNTGDLGSSSPSVLSSHQQGQVGLTWSGDTLEHALDSVPSADELVGGEPTNRA